MKSRKERFIETYETKIKGLRKNYYQNIININTPKIPLVVELSIKAIPLIIALFFLLIGGIKITNILLTLLILFILDIILEIYETKNNLNTNNLYLREIRKYGFLTIEDYEDKLKEYITGDKGEYTKLHNQLKQKYNITDQTDIIEDMGGNRYYLWYDHVNSKIYLLNTSVSVKPEIEIFRLIDIRYFRIDRKKQVTILKTDIEEKYFNTKAYDVLSKYIKSKQYENLKTYNPEENINDFERYLHQIKKELDGEINYDTNQKSRYFTSIVIYLIFIIGLTILYNFDSMENIRLMIEIAMIIELCLIHFNIKQLVDYQPITKKTEKEYIKYLNSNQDIIDRFNELKISLNIPQDAEQVLTPEGAPYLVWSSGGYFHVFLNLIYFDIVFMVVKLTEVEFFNKEGNKCIVKLKDRTLQFDKDAIKTLAKILPNKDKSWINSLQK